jgi:TRAP-type C4-dicarboxylate transport system permease small subunit
MKTLNTAKTVLDRILGIVCVSLFMVLVGVVTWQVFARQVLGEPSQWSESLARYLFVWLGLLGAALVFGERGHIAIDVVVRRLPSLPQKIVALVVQAGVIAFSAYILVFGGLRATDNAWNQDLSGLPTTIGPWFLVMPIAGVLVIFYTLHHMVAIIRGDEESFEPDDIDTVEAV